MRTQSTVGILATTVLALGLTACATTRARLTRVEAERIALTEAPAGKVVAAELEKEQGVLVWSFDISVPGTSILTEVLVDATSGTVVAVEQEDLAAQELEEQVRDER